VIAMSDGQNYKIAFYLVWCGVETTHQFENQSQYNTARAFLDKISKTHIHGDALPPAYLKKFTDFYVIEKEQRAAFQNFMQNFRS
jgi:hypothetical protein